jgi:tetratricopeptide (TPR) repeat protein
MNRRWVLLSALSISTACVLLRAAFAGEPEWIETTSPHFSVVTDAGERRGREVATRFEQMRAVYASLMTKANVNIPVPLQIVAFRNTKELRQVSPLWNGKPVQLAGLFQGGKDRCYIMLDMSVDNPWNVVFHEYAHQLMNGTLTDEVDPWFEEGFAEYFSSIEVDSHQARVGKIPPMTYQILQHEGLMKITDLFRVQHNSSTYNESGDRRTVFYSESSMVVHFLFDHGMIPKLATYFDLKLGKKVPVEEAIQQSFGMSAGDFEKEIRRYLASGEFKYYYMKTPAEIETTGYTTKPLSSQNAAAVMADIHLHTRDYHEKAMAEFDEILKSDPNNAAACRGMGYAYLEKRDFEEAGEYFRRAAKLDSKDARVHYYSGLLSNMKGSQASQSDLEFVTTELKTAIELDPNFADAHMQLAFAQARSDDIAGALVSARKAISLSPRNTGYYFNLADLYMQEHKTDHAMAIFRALAKSNDQMVAIRASAALGQLEQMEAVMKQVDVPPSGEITGGRDAAGAAAPSVASVAVSSGPIKFLKGTIVAVDCSSPPTATLTISSGGKSWTMQVNDSRHVLVLGADGFSCSWSKQKASLNYREAGETTGSVVSIEIQ